MYFSNFSPILILLMVQMEISIQKEFSEEDAFTYLAQFGYLSTLAESGPQLGSIAAAALIDRGSLKKAIADFQEFAGLPITGELDNSTSYLMTQPRCGVKDKIGTGANRSKRFALQGSRWKVKDLKYRITSYPRNLQKSAVDDELAEAFNVWSRYTDLTFEQVSSGARAHIEILFKSGAHGDGDPFDGRGGTLAHAYFPVYGGDAHFDADEQWTIKTYRGTNLLQVAAHEFGHSLGLSHSDVKEALMAPFYRGYNPSFVRDGLPYDDIRGIQALYGSKTASKPPPPPPNDDMDDDNFDFDESPTTTDDSGGGGGSNPCQNPQIDTIFQTPNNKTIVFKGAKYWLLLDNGTAPGYPKYIGKYWIGLEDNIDAAFSFSNGKTYFFKGGKYWRYTGGGMDRGYPKAIAEGFPGIEKNLDAAFVWGGNGKLYFFKGEKFWRYDPTAKPPVKNSYPKPVSNWLGVPNGINAAFQWYNGYTYFFKGNAYYRFDDRNFQVDLADPQFPRSTAHWWFGCKNMPRGTLGAALTTSESRRVQHNNWLVGAEDNAQTQTDHENSEFRMEANAGAILQPQRQWLIVYVTITMTVLTVL